MISFNISSFWVEKTLLISHHVLCFRSRFFSPFVRPHVDVDILDWKKGTLPDRIFHNSRA